MTSGIERKHWLTGLAKDKAISDKLLALIPNHDDKDKYGRDPRPSSTKVKDYGKGLWPVIPKP